MRRAFVVVALIIVAGLVLAHVHGRNARADQPLPPCVDGQYGTNAAGTSCQVRGDTSPTARCWDGSFDYTRSIAACSGHGGVLEWLPPPGATSFGGPQPVYATVAPLAGASPVTATPTPTPGPVTSSGSLPIAVTASLSTATCSGGSVTITATVTDSSGAPVPNATVYGNVAYRTSTVAFAFPATGPSGVTSEVVDTGQPSGGYTVLWTVTALANGFTASATTSCYAP